MRTALVVLGMHRSGTSALTGALAQAGCDLPASLLPGDRWNPKGHFESTRITDELDSLLHSAGSRWDDWLPLSPTWTLSDGSTSAISRLAAVVAEEYGTSELFVLKDPRSCRLVDVWIDVLAILGCEPVFIHIHRHPMEVAASLARRNAIPADLGLLIWLRHVLEAEAGSRGYRRAFTSYEAIMSDWPSELTRLQHTTDLPQLALRSGTDLQSSLSDDLRHWVTTSTPDRVSDSRWINTTWMVLERWRVEGENATDHPTLVRVLEEFNASAPEYIALGFRLENSIRTVRAQALELAELKSMLAKPLANSVQPDSDGIEQ